MAVGWIIEDDGKGKHQSVRARFSFENIGGRGEYGLHVTAYGANETEARAAAQNQLEKLAEFINELRR